MSRQPSVQAVACVLQAAVSQIYSENQEQKAELNHLKTLQLGWQGNACKLGVGRIWLLQRLES